MASASNGKSQTTPASVAYQGEPGANSHIACINYDKRLEPVACATFEDAISAVRSGAVRYALIPVENSVAGRVADVHIFCRIPAFMSSASISSASTIS